MTTSHSHPSKGWNFSSTQKTWQLRRDSPDKYHDSVKHCRNHLTSSVLAVPAKEWERRGAKKKLAPLHDRHNQVRAFGPGEFSYILHTKRAWSHTLGQKRHPPALLCHHSHLLQSSKNTRAWKEWGWTQFRKNSERKKSWAIQKEPLTLKHLSTLLGMCKTVELADLLTPYLLNLSVFSIYTCNLFLLEIISIILAL